MLKTETAAGRLSTFTRIRVSAFPAQKLLGGGKKLQARRRLQLPACSGDSFKIACEMRRERERKRSAAAAAAAAAAECRVTPDWRGSLERFSQNLPFLLLLLHLHFFFSSAQPISFSAATCCSCYTEPANCPGRCIVHPQNWTLSSFFFLFFFFLFSGHYERKTSF